MVQLEPLDLEVFNGHFLREIQPNFSEIKVFMAEFCTKIESEMHSLPDYPDYHNILFPYDKNDGFKKKKNSSYIENKKLASPPNRISKPVNLSNLILCEPLNEELK